MTLPDRQAWIAPSQQIYDLAAAQAPPPMRSFPNKDYPGRFFSVSEKDLSEQRDKGWPDFHPEDFCHRCGHPNVGWFVSPVVWNQVMRKGDSAGWGDWQEIICIPCFMGLADAHFGTTCTWRIARLDTGTEILKLVSMGASYE